MKKAHFFLEWTLGYLGYFMAISLHDCPLAPREIPDDLPLPPPGS